MTPPAFTKPLEQITADDIAALVGEKYPENEVAEFKERLPSKDGQAHPWYSDATDIGDRARNEILAEVIAFANAHGGHVLLGIKESDEHPRHAVAITPVPRCADLAERLKMHLRDCVEPQIPLVRVRAIPTEPDGSGVVIIRVPESRSAPHRLIPTRDCFIRRADRSEKMTMREIQDLTLSRAQGSAAIDKTLDERREEFRNWLLEPKADDGLGIRATAIPLADLYFDKVYNNAQAFPQLQRCTLRVGGSSEIKALLPKGYMQDRPIMRGAERRERSSESAVVQVLRNNGLAEIWYHHFPKQPERFGLFPTWVLGAAGNVMFMVDAFRTAVGSPDVEYLLSIELRARSGATVPVFPIWRDYPGMTLGTTRSPLLLPLLSVGPRDEFGRLLGIATNDLLNACAEEGLDGPFELR